MTISAQLKEDFVEKIESFLKNYFENVSNPTDKQKEDLSKIKCGYQNITSHENQGWLYTTGLIELRPTYYVYLVEAGFSHEFPVTIALYWDGDSVRFYIPTEGNVFNKEEMRAFNISKDDITVDALKSWKEEINTDAMIGEMRAKFRFV